MREPRGNLERRLESIARAKRREQRPEVRKISWRELKNELERSQAAERHMMLTVVSLNNEWMRREENLENDS